MGLLKDVAIGALGYGVASARNSNVVGDIIDNNITSKTLEEIISNYAKRKLDIYTQNNDFAHRLHKIAKKYEEYDYYDVYADDFF